MKKIFFALFVLLACNSFANEIAGDYIVGKIYRLNGDTLTAKIHLSNLGKNFVRKLYFDNFGHYLDEKNKVRGLDPNEIKGFELKVDDKLYRFISLQKLDKKNHPTDKKLFYHLLNKSTSTVKLYEYYNSSDIIPGAVLGGALGAMAAAQTVDNQYMIEYNNRVLYHPKRDDFKNDKLIFILSDDAELAGKIKDGTYLYDDMLLIISEYNNWYGTK